MKDRCLRCLIVFVWFQYGAQISLPERNSVPSYATSFMDDWYYGWRFFCTIERFVINHVRIWSSISSFFDIICLFFQRHSGRPLIRDCLFIQEGGCEFSLKAGSDCFTQWNQGREKNILSSLNGTNKYKERERDPPIFRFFLYLWFYVQDDYVAHIRLLPLYTTKNLSV